MRLGLVLLAAASAVIAVGAMMVVGASPRDAATKQDVAALTLAALGSEGDDHLHGNGKALEAKYTGRALERQKALMQHVQNLIRQQDDYPGPLHLSNERVLAVSGSGDSYTIDVQFHAVRDNMKSGRIVDQSESEVIWHVTVVRTAGGWRISDMQARFAPGGGP
jgi:hypothetical protein